MFNILEKKNKRQLSIIVIQTIISQVDNIYYTLKSTTEFYCTLVLKWSTYIDKKKTKASISFLCVYKTHFIKQVYLYIKYP